jgi:hypothetical protein
MNTYTVAKEGSLWAKWDLHVHTPETKLSDAYSAGNGDPWEKFIEEIDNSDVRVIGITDYFSIDNYEKCITRYKSKSRKGNKVFFPNIEFRLDVSVNKMAEEVNVHVVFDNDISIQDIKRFLDRLGTNITENGHKISCSNLTKKQTEGAAVNFDDLVSSLHDTFGNQLCYIIGAAVNNQGLRPDTNSPRKMYITDEIDRKCQFIFGGHQNRDYYLGTNRYENREPSLKKPVISGSDAHSFDDLKAKLGKGQFCTWIKAMPTFNGLRQILFEPEYRVKIQVAEPDYKEPHNIIKSISISDENNCFGNQHILINKNLNTIIGGKSSGKSLLLYSLAESIDAEQLRRLKNKFNKFVGYDTSKVNVCVEWADGLVDTNNTDDFWDMDDNASKHKITYIPQLYINHLAEKNGRAELNSLIDEILLQNNEYKNFKVDIDANISELNGHISTALNNLMELRNEWMSISQKRKEYATSDVYAKEIVILNTEYEKLKAVSSFTQKEIEDYRILKDKIANHERDESSLTDQIHYLRLIKNEVLQQKNNLLGSEQAGAFGSLHKIFNKVNFPSANISRMIKIIESGYSKIMQDIENEFSITSMEAKLKDMQKTKIGLEKEFAKYNNKISSQSGLSEIIKKIDKLKHDKNGSMELSFKYNSMQEEYQKIKMKISELLHSRNQLYQQIENRVNEKMKNLGSEILLSCKIAYDLESLKLFGYVNRQYSNDNIQLLFDETNKSINYNYLPDLFLNLSRVDDKALFFKDKSSIPLKARTSYESICGSLIEDNFYITYDVTYKGDNLLNMSPGKMGTVLLILFLELSSSENPILIDQPEDNLDNRTIYDLLCKMIKEKKKDRQIIIVTHNANLVVNTDAENVIVANQEGQDPAVGTIEGRTRFEYINGPIELSFKKGKSAGVLAKIGIKQHVCDILEGGEEAFKLRERKYQEELKN